ncbi:MAG: histidine kinase, partial [Bacteroidota bacterium]
MGNQSVLVFQRLSQWYLMALTAIAIVLLLSQWLIQTHLDKQASDSRIVNVAGRQRMLSQKLAKEVLLLSKLTSQEAETDISTSLENTLELWTQSHEGLKNRDETLNLPGENSAVISIMFDEIEPYFIQMVQGSQEILSILKQESYNPGQLDSLTQVVLTNEEAFLQKMDEIVFQYDEEAKNKVFSLRRTEYFLLIFALATLLLELVFLFRPTAKYVRNIIQNLVKAEEVAQQNTEEITHLYKSKEQSILELRALNFALDQASLFASTTVDGNLIYISEKLAKFLGFQNDKPEGQFAEILSSNEGEQQYIASLLQTPRSTIWNGEVSITTRSKDKAWLELSIVPVNRRGVKQDYLILCNDITARKETEAQLTHLNKEKFKEEIRLQKIRALQVVEAQENERKRIARDMHDGIGQMLTALKFNLESVDPEKHPVKKTKEKIEDLKSLSSKLIKGVRIATFNLTPPELTDYGLPIALSKLSVELRKLTSENILFDNKTHFTGRLHTIVETNIYRVVQEAVNNAIKYAKASYILITLAHSNELLSLVVEDDGVGFNYEEQEEKEISEDG